MSRRTKTKRPYKNQARRAAPSLGQRGRLVLPLLIAIALVACVLGSVLLFHNPATGKTPTRPTPIPATGNTPPTPKPKIAAIVDQLALTFPNPAFAQAATAILEQAGYAVDYFPGEQVTVDFYRNLAASGYDPIILRVHSAIVTEVDKNEGKVTQTEYVGLFTGEPFNEIEHVELELGHVGPANYYVGAPPLFGIAPDFITHDMWDTFDDALIIMMGCDGLRTEITAQAFLDKGARAYVGWDRGVSASHTDAAIQRLLEQLFVRGLPVDRAIAQTMAEVGPDPAYGAELQVLFTAK